MFQIEIGHNVEMAHRLSTTGSPQKCRSIHGHSWWITVTISGEEVDSDGILVEFGAFKKAWRGWLDSTLDHALALDANDHMVAVLRRELPDQRLWVIDGNPTTERVAELLAARAHEVLEAVSPDVNAMVRKVHVQETRVNAASYVVANS